MNSPYLDLPMRNLITAQIGELSQKMKDGEPPILLVRLALDISQKLTEGAEWRGDVAACEAFQDLRKQLSETISDYLVPAERALQEQENEKLWQEWISDNPGVRAPRDDRWTG